jgi:RsiW-degrading membrane proteinase PrsW (M82 family)/DNA-directed RNA polymerase subunit RPC12/RpoP
VPISLICHGCGKRLKAKDTLAGRTLPCPSCGAKLLVAKPQADAAKEPVFPAPAPETSPDTEDAPLRLRNDGPPPLPAPKPSPLGKPKRPSRQEVSSLLPLTTDDPPLLLRHMHWMLVLFLIPLAASLLQGRDERDFVRRLIDTVEQSPPEVQVRVGQVIENLKSGKGSLESLFEALPDHKFHDAWLPRDTWNHWLITLAATALFLLFLGVLSLEGSASPQSLFLVGLFTATVGIVFLLIVQAVASLTQNVIIVPRGIFGILFWIVKLIGFSYRAALDPEYGFLLSFMGYTLGVGLCEEICKALPIIVKYHRRNKQTWLGAYLWGLASGAGFGLSEGVTYAGDFYNGVSGPGIYFVRFMSCVALHALWTGSAAITIHQKQYLFQEPMTWYEWLLRALAVVAVPMVLHGLYDTLLKKEMNALALAVAVLSFLYLAFQISRLRGADDEQAHEGMLREYSRRRRAMEA